MILNPHHPMMHATEGQWHKICAILMQKFGHQEIVITASDIDALEPCAIAVHEKQDGLHLYFVDEEPARRLARESGGLPQ